MFLPDCQRRKNKPCMLLKTILISGLSILCNFQLLFGSPNSFSEHRAHWDACNGISSWKMLSLHKTLPYCQHCKSPHTQRKFKYLFIFRANKTYSQLQNCPVQTRQRRHIQCKSFPCWLGDLRCYEYECYITIVASINCLFWLECKKEKSVWLLTFSPRRRASSASVMWRTVGWAERKPNRNVTRCHPVKNKKKKAAKTAIAHKMKFPPNFLLCAVVVFS